jgi:hypothetical protein
LAIGDGLACSGSRRVGSAWLDLPGAGHRRMPAQATSLWHWFDSDDFVRGVAVRGYWIAVVVWWFDSVLWGWAALLAISTTILEMRPMQGALWRAWRAPCARERGSPTADVARPPRVEVARTRCFHSVGWLCFVTLALRRWVLHDCWLLMWWCLPLLLLYRLWITLEFWWLQGCGMCVDLWFVLSFSNVVVSWGSVVLMSKSDRSASVVELYPCWCPNPTGRV